ncbi:hypothetical protein [Campylobacter concisus]|uniref:hypothetical protein n=1 Tax=Campylobacter concisus TaxID=199 RepID=UPI00112F9DDB|nr:hypothetical protein [Campylobacter concisus]
MAHKNRYHALFLFLARIRLPYRLLKNTRFGLNLLSKMPSQASTLFTFIAAFQGLCYFLEQEAQALKVTLARHFQNRVDQILSYI